MQYTTPRNSRLYNSRRGSDLDFEVAEDVRTLALFPEILRSPSRIDRDLPFHLRTREDAVLECSPYFQDSQVAGRILNRIGHRSNKYGFDGEAQKHIALVATLALGYTDNVGALQSIETLYLSLLKRESVRSGDNFDKVMCLLERAVNEELNGRPKINPARIPRLL